MFKILQKFVFLILECLAIPLSAQEYVPVLQETFSNCRSSQIQGGYFSENNYFEADKNADNPGWFSTNAYPSERALKLGTKVKSGKLLSPALHLSGEGKHNIKVSFRAQLWFTGTRKDTTDIAVAIDGKPETKQTLDIISSENVTDRSKAPFELTFDNVSDGDKIVFTNGNVINGTRFFLADIIVYQSSDDDDPILLESTSFHRFNDIMAGAESEVRSVDIIAENLNSPIDISLEKIKNFTITPSKEWSKTKGGRLNITFTPINAGIKEDTLYIKSGELSQRLIISGKAKIYTPEVAQATDIKPDGFTANWNTEAGADSMEICVYTLQKSPLIAKGLMISKYIEGKSNNRALEIFNGTGQDVALKGYQLRMEVNGSGGLTAGTFDFPDKTLANGKTYTIVNANFNAVKEIADTLIGFSNGGYSNIVTFTGDDAIGLFSPAGKLIDIIGYENMDINDRVDGNWGQDHSFYRRNTVYEPQTKFYPEEWEIHDKDYVENFGQHALAAEGETRKIEKKVIVDGKAVSAVIDGLKPSTTYYYAIKSFSGNYQTRFTDAVKVITSPSTSIENVTTENIRYRIKGNILITSSSSPRLFTIDGKEISHNNSGVFLLSSHGIYLLVADGKTTKIID